jgi:RimJ/RimL family protein N-acetyltransferase
MTKTIQPLTGKYVTLRPMGLDDASFIFNLRNDPSNSRYIEIGVKSIETQIAWTKQYLDSDTDHYFVIIDNAIATPIGTIAVYRIQGKTAEVGRLIVQNNPWAAWESIYLTYEYGFERLSLDMMHFTTFTTNHRAIRMHNFYGAKWIKVLKDYGKQNGILFDEHYYEVDRDLYYAHVKPALEKILQW